MSVITVIFFLWGVKSFLKINLAKFNLYLVCEKVSTKYNWFDDSLFGK